MHRKIVSFGGFRFDPEARELTRGGGRIRLQEKPCLVLAALLSSRGEPVSRERLRELLWDEATFVDFENNLNSAVASLRAALNDSAREPRYIETLPRLGYRFVGTAVVEGDGQAAHHDSGRRASSARRVALLVGLPLILSGLGGLWMAFGSRSEPPKMMPREFLEAVYLTEQETEASLSKAIARFDRALAKNPDFAPALAGKADALARSSFYSSEGARDRLARARELAERALALDASLTPAHRVRGLARLHLDWDIEGAERAIETALRYDARDAHAHLAMASCLAVRGRYEEAVTSARQAIAIAPGSFLLRADVGYFLLAAGRFEEAVAESRAALELEPAFTPAMRVLLLASERLGELEEAVAVAEELLRLQRASSAELAALQSREGEAALTLFREWELERAKERSDPPLSLALKLASLGRSDEALVWLERAHREGSVFFVFLPTFPELDGLHGHPLYEALVRAIDGRSDDRPPSALLPLEGTQARERRSPQLGATQPFQ